VTQNQARRDARSRMQTAGRHAPRRTCRRCREPPACPASRSCRTDQAEPQTAAPPRSCSVHSPDERWSMRRPACPRLPDSGRLRPSSKDRAAAGRGRWRPHSRKRSAMHAITISNIACRTRSRIAPTSFLPGERNTCSRKSHCRCCRGDPHDAHAGLPSRPRHGRWRRRWRRWRRSRGALRWRWWRRW
jgi:hypothetical protein